MPKAKKNNAAGCIGDALHGLMPSKGSSKLSKRPVTIVPANHNYNKKDKLMQDMGTRDSIVIGWGN